MNDSCEPAPASPKAYERLAEEIEDALHEHVIGVWFPRCAETPDGGFHQSFARDWSPLPDLGKTTVFQARITWIAAQVALRRPERRDDLLRHVFRGLAMLEELWDAGEGGFFWRVRDRSSDDRYFKYMYAQAFAIFAAAAAYEATGDARALDLAIRAWQWLDQHAHDERHGGYFETLRRDGAAVPESNLFFSLRLRRPRFPPSLKSSNTHIHLLEACTALYRVWKDRSVKARLAELLSVIRDRLMASDGFLYQQARADWTPLPGALSYGHDIEAAFLMVDAADALGELDARTLQSARKLVDHVLAFAWDADHGGIFETGPPGRIAAPTRKKWWPQVETLNSLSLMHELVGNETDQYWRALQTQWRFIRTALVDHEHRGLFEEVTADGRPYKTSKGHEWKAAYHDGRAFLLTADRLRRLWRPRQDSNLRPTA